MSYNDYMYAIDRSDEYLAHYGIKGMKWGVRKAIESGNSRKLMRQYKKAQKHLAKLKARANNGAKYARRAALLGAGAAAAGGVASAGVSKVVSATGRLVNNVGSRIGGRKFRGASDALHATLYGSRGTRGLVNNLRDWGNSNSIASGTGKKIADTVSRYQIRGLRNVAAGGSKIANAHMTEDAGRKIFESNRAKAANATKNISNNTIARAGAAAIGAGLAAGAGYNAYRAATTKRAARKAAEFEREMNKTFKGTGVERIASGSNSNRRKNRRHR